MPSTCCVPGCNQPATFRLPSDAGQQKLWVNRISRAVPGKGLWQPNECDRICERHFSPDDIIIRKALNSERTWRVLKPGATPFKTTRPPNPLVVATARDRDERAKRRRTMKDAFPDPVTVLGESVLQQEESQKEQHEHEEARTVTTQNAKTVDQEDLEEEEDVLEEDLEEEEDDLEEDLEEEEEDDNSEEETKVDENQIPEAVIEVEVEEEKDANFVSTDHDMTCMREDYVDAENDINRTGVGVPSFGDFTIESLKKIPGGIHYYTSLADIHHFNYVFSCLGPAAFHLKYKSTKLKPQDEFLLTLMKLRHNKDDQELAMFFGISTFTVGQVFKTWINFMYYQWKELKLWTSRKLVDQHFPSDFKKKFPSTRCIIDATEVPIEKPKNLRDQSATWSNYKNKNTLKVMVGISPRGDITHISEVYGGSASDRQIVERSELLSDSKMFKKGDSVMGDKGFICQDLFLLKQVFLNIPTVMRGMSQIPPDKVVKDRKIASKRVHIERIIGLAKHFKILQDTLDHSYVPMGGRIIFVCFAICNFKPCMLSKNA